MDAPTLPRYHCHKTVSAAKIALVRIETDATGTYVYLVPDEAVSPGVDVLRVSPEYAAKHRPTPGGYYIRYDDGYESFSPAAPFEAGYTRVTSSEE